MSDDYVVLDRALTLARAFLAVLPDRPVKADASFHDLVSAIGVDLPEKATSPVDAIQALERSIAPGIMPTAGPRYFGFVTGGSTPAAVAADWLVSAWDQNCGLNVMSPAAAAVEDVAARWVLDLLSLPAASSVGFVTGAHMANVTALASARHEMLRRVGWDVEASGLQGAPRLTVVAGEEAHASIGAACRMVGLGAATILRVAADDQGRMRADALRTVMSGVNGPAIVCAQAGNVNTGACDPFPEIVPIARAHGAWLHVDGAFGLWAAASPAHAHLTRGVEAADSWTTDAHKWLNVPYDSGIVIVAHPAAHRAAMGQAAAYLIRAEREERDGMDWVPEASRRARAIPVYAAIRALGRSGVADMVARCCAGASRMAARLRSEPGVRVLNEIVLNQALVRFDSGGGSNVTPLVMARVQQDGTCWCGGTQWQGEPAMRISVSNWRTTEEDIDRSADAILRCHRAIAGSASPV